MARQLRTVRNNEEIQLALHSVGNRDPWIVDAILVDRQGEGMDERLILVDKGDPRRAQWEIFRFKGRWAWGTMGGRVTVHDPDAPPRKPRTVKPKAVTPKTAPIKKDVPTAPANGQAKRRPGRPRKNAQTPVAATV